MKKIIILSLALVAIGLSSCSDKEDPTEQDTYLEIVTEIQTRSTAITTNFEENDRIMIDADGIKATGTYSSQKWSLSPQVKVEKNETLDVTAIYPYTTADITDIPIDIRKQVDYLYATTTVTQASPVAHLKMKHALSSLAFNIQGNGTVERVSFVLPSEGILDAITGNIKPGESKSQELLVNRSMNAEGWTENVPDVFVMPFSELKELTVTIDGNDYSVKLQEQIGQGTKYILRLIYTGSSLYLTGMEQVSMDQYTDKEQSGIRKNNLSITYSSKHLFQVGIPIIDAQLGTICWGDGTEEAYAEDITHNYQAGIYVMTLEAISSAYSFTIPNVEYVEEIDLRDSQTKNAKKI